MANSKISALTSATTPVAGTEVLPIVQSSATKQVSIANLTAGRSVSAADYVMSTGNLVPSTANKGINFTANTAGAGMSSQLLNFYEEGTWTPAFAVSGGGLAVTYTSQVGSYTRVGRLVFVVGNIITAGKTANGIGILQVTGLPYTIKSTGGSEFGGCVGISYNWASNPCTNILPSAGTTTALLNYNATNSSCVGADLGLLAYFRFSITYQV
ncbi:MAG: hypothetical protein WCP79_11740 [Bacillota bacterium]